MSVEEGWTVEEIQESKWAYEKLDEPWGVTLETGQWGLVLKVYTLSQVLARALAAGLGPRQVYTLRAQVDTWAGTLNLADISVLAEATKSLSGDQRLDTLGRWFNSGGGLPAQGPEPGKHGEQTRLNLGHPALLNQFIRWVIRYLALHESVDGRVDRDCERMINLARELQDKAPVRRY